MLLLGSRLISTPLMSLQTGTRLGLTKAAVIDPSNLKIIAYEVEGALLNERPSFICIADIRELSDIGLIIDSNDELVGVNDVLAIKKIRNLNFNLTGIKVIDERKHKLGKVTDFNVNTDDFIIQQLVVKRSSVKSLTEPELLIHRRQIIEVNDDYIMVRNASQKLEPIQKPIKLSYINPFRQPLPQPESSKI